MPVELGFHLTAIPFAVLAVGLAAMAAVPAVVRGDPVVRLGFVMIALCALPWAAATTLVACADDPRPMLPLMRASFAPLPLVGAGLLMVMLGVAGRVDDHRRVLVASILINAGLMLLCAASATVIPSMQLTRWGLWYPRAGALYGLFIASIPICVVYGAWATRGGPLPGAGARRAMLAVGALAVLAVGDVLLMYGVFGVYPMSWLPSLVAVVVSLHAMLARDVLRSRGLERGALVEAALAAAALLALGGLAAATRAPAILAVATGLATAAMVAVGRTASLAEVATAPARDRALEALIDALEFAESDHEIGATVRAQLGRAGPLADVRIWLGDDALRPAGDRTGPELAVPAEVRAFLLRLDRPIPIGDLATERLGRLRPPLLAWAGAIGADVLVPLCERDQLIGLVVGNLTGGRALRDLERRQLAEGARAIARAHTVTSLRRGIEARASLSREVELADVVRQARTSGGRRMVAGVEVAIAYHPAAHVAGDLWFTGELADGRAFVLIGDVTGRGTPAALVSAAVIGACQSATGLADATATPASVLTHLHQVVRAIDGGRHRVTATALMIERAQGDAPGRVSLAIAGHRGGYLARASGAGDAIELVPLVGRGAPLGEPEWRTSELAHDLAPGDTIVVVSDGVTAARNRAGAAWGERRLQRTLRGASGGVALAEVTLAALDDHVGDNRLDDDVLVVAVAP